MMSDSPPQDGDGERSRQSSALGMLQPEVPDYLRKDSVTLDDFVIPEPEFTVVETVSKDPHAYGLPTSSETVVYKVWLNFGELGAWDIFVTFSDLSALFYKLKMNKMLAFKPLAGIGNRFVRHKSAGGRGGLVQRQSERRILLPQVSQRGFGASNETSARPMLPMMRSISSSSPVPSVATDGAAAAAIGSPATGAPPGRRGSDASAPAGEKHMSVLLAKLLVPVVGTAARIRKVKADRVRAVQYFFHLLVANETVRNTPFVKEFLGISTLTFDSRFGVSLKEGWVKVDVHARERANEKLQWKGKISCCCCICACAPDPQRAKSCLQPSYRRNRKLWAVVKPSFVAFFEKGPNELDARMADFVLLYSRGYEINKSYSTTGSHRRIMLVSDSLTVRIKYSNRWQKKVWAKALRAAAELTSVNTDTLVGEHASNPENILAGWSDTHQNQSFAPRRRLRDEPGAEVCKARFHIDGQSYFHAVFDALEAAESQIFIQGWWVTANLPLLRPASSMDKTKTIAGLVERKAKDGVKVSILMYNAVSLALPLDSAFQEKEFRRLEGQANISVIRHPQHKIKTNSIWFWSHHEKLVVVDQKHAFCGGIDLAWGRYDTHAHRLYDSRTHAAVDAERDWPGIDFSNVRAHDFEDVANYGRLQHPDDCPRMPWHDVHCEYWGAIARDIARHFVHQWNHARFANGGEAEVPALVPMDVLPHDYRVPLVDPSGDAGLSPGTLLPGPGHHDELDDHAMGRNGAARRRRTHSGNTAGSAEPPGWQGPRSAGGRHRNGGLAKAEAGALVDVPEDRMSNATLMESDLDDEEEDRLSHDADLNEARDDQEEEEEEEALPPPPKLPPTVQSSHETLLAESGELADLATSSPSPENGEAAATPSSDAQRSRGASVDSAQSAGVHSAYVEHDRIFNVNAQAVRSLGLWSGCGPGEKERSIEKAMRNLIEDAERFIYIENQFFISGLDSDNIVANRVLDTLFKRILRAHQAKTPFKVIVIIPLLPGFDGHIQDSASIRRVLYYEYRCINRGPNSLFQNLLRKGIDPDQHIFFFGLRAWQTLGVSNSKADEILGLRRVATELIYVHSKVLIVDDTKCIIGSGNINDRSLSGNRDTEFAVVLEAPARSSSQENFVRSFRLALMSEHWGIQDDPHDPLWKALRSPWRPLHFARLLEVAQGNTKAFEEIFKCLPRNDVRDAADLRRHSESRYVVIDSSNAIEHYLETHIKGHIVEFPLQFLNQYELRPGIIEDSTGAILGDEVFI